MTLRALIFDVDGTLAETEELHRRAFNETFAQRGLGWHWDTATYRRLLRTTGGQERMRAWRDELGVAHPDDALITEIHREKTVLWGRLLAEGGLPLRPGVAELVEQARRAGLRVGVATTTNPANVDALSRACWGRPAHEVFDAVAAGDEVAIKKPAPDVYFLALERLGVDPAEAVAVEDSLNGIRAARAAGIRVIAAPGTYTDDEDHAEADWRFPNLGAALPALRQDAAWAALFT